MHDILRKKYARLEPVLDERSRRLWAATEALALGRGGIAAVERATGISRSTISRGIKELVGDFKNTGREWRREWRPKGSPEPVRVHDFLIPEQGKAIPYGIYDLTRNEGWVSVGIDHDTASFAVKAIGRWWEHMGRPAYPEATSLLITADGGGSHGSRIRRWKWELQQFATRTGLAVTVCHLPPGTSKWNKIEHRFFSYIAMNWRGKPLVSLAAIVNLISSTRTETGLRVRSEIDTGRYATGTTVTDAQMASLSIERHDFHGDWNYTIRPERVV